MPGPETDHASQICSAEFLSSAPIGPAGDYLALQCSCLAPLLLPHAFAYLQLAVVSQLTIPQGIVIVWQLAEGPEPSQGW